MAEKPVFRDPVRNVNPEILANLELADTRVYPLPGGTGRRWTSGIDPRLSQLHKMGGTPTGDSVCFYEHIATVRDKKNKVFYVAFRETVDAQLAREADLKKFPEWLMKDPKKQRERLIHIYIVLKDPSKVPIMRPELASGLSWYRLKAKPTRKEL
ncbi:MAG: hypothetical protein ACRYGF_04935 [Janthinobacterium lividum]